MLKLDPLQKLFQKDLFGDASAHEKELLSEQLEHAGRMSVYSEGFPSRILDALIECYPALRAGLGEELFEALAWDYARVFRPTHFNLGHAALALPEFIETHPSNGEYPMLVDLARLERALDQSFHARSATPLAVETLQSWMGQNPAGIRFQIQDHFQVLSSHWPLLEMWKSYSATRQLDLGAFARQSQRTALFVCRNENFRLSLYPLDPLEDVFLTTLQKGASLGEACASLEPLTETASEPPAIAEWLSEACELGLFTEESSIEEARTEDLPPSPEAS